MNNRTKLFGATDAAKKKLSEGGYKFPFDKPKPSGCTALGCGVSAKPGTANKTPPAEKQENGAK